MASNTNARNAYKTALKRSASNAADKYINTVVTANRYKKNMQNRVRQAKRKAFNTAVDKTISKVM